MFEQESELGTRNHRPRPIRSRKHGFSLMEIVVVLSIVGVVLSMGVASFSDWSTRQRLINSAGEFAQILFVGRVEAIRKGANHIVFFGSDALGGNLVAEDGTTSVAALLIEDINGNYAPDAGEQRMVVPLSLDTSIVWGRTQATVLVPTTSGSLAGDPFSGTSVEGSLAAQDSAAHFRHPSQQDTAQSWVLFAPDGTPRAFDPSGAATVAGIGTGDGAIYVSDGERDRAVVMTALGAIRSYRWDLENGSWK